MLTIDQRELSNVLKSWAATKEMGSHTLARLSVVEGYRQEHGFSDEPTGYGLALKEILRGAIESLGPDLGNADSLDKRWRPYVILIERYVKDQSPEHVMGYLALSSRQYYSEQKRAVDRLAVRLQELEEQHRAASRPEKAELRLNSRSDTVPMRDEVAEQQKTVPVEEAKYENLAQVVEIPVVTKDERSELPHRPSRLLLVAFFSVAIAMLVFAGLFLRKPMPMPTPTMAVVTKSPITTLPPASPTLVQAIVLCDEKDRIVAPPVSRLLRSQGVSAFTVENTAGGVQTNRVRSLVADMSGLWIGYFATSQYPNAGLGQYDKKSWVKCSPLTEAGMLNVNALITDSHGRLWIGMEKAGIFAYEGKSWRRYTTSDGLPSDEIFGLSVDGNGAVWAGTWEGVAKYDGSFWSVPYTVQKQTIFNNRVHAIAFDSLGNIWVGHLGDGVSLYRKSEGRWVRLTTQTSEIGGNHIRAIAVRKADLRAAESLWFATHDGGVSKFEQGEWAVYRASNGFISDDVRAIAVDKYNRIWAATDKGVVYFDGSRWVVYDTLDTLSIAFGPNCQGCPFDDEHIWTGTATMGLTHSRVPYLDNETAVQVRGICLENTAKGRFCQSVDEQPARSVITATYPTPLLPGEKLRIEVILSPRAPYQLREDRGDFLSNIADTDDQLYGTWTHIAVKGVVEPNQSFTFTDYENLLRVPRLAEGETERTFSSTWRVWMHTRYVGPYVQIVGRVQKIQ